MMTVWVIKVYDDGMNIDGVYATKEGAIERAADLAEYCGMEAEVSEDAEDEGCLYLSESGESIEVVEMDVL
jgi:hypothetical protein